MDELFLRSADDCDAARRLPAWHAPRHVFVRLGLALEREQAIEQRLSRLQRVCGCHASAAAMALTLGAGLLFVWGAGSGGALRSLLVFLAAGLVGGITKTAAICIATRAFRHDLRDLADFLRSRSPDRAETSRPGKA